MCGGLCYTDGMVRVREPEPITARPERWKYTPPKLINGDRLSLAEFNYLYKNSPHIRRAELIEGVVYVASPVYLPHGYAQADIIGVLYTYSVHTPHTVCVGEQSVELDGDNAVQPDSALWIEDAVDESGGIVVGSPTLVVEVASSTRSYDLGAKKRVYRRNKVQEYLVLSAFEKKVFWFRWVDGVYVEIEPDEDGVYKSEVFPGLWLDSMAFWERDGMALMEVLQAGIKSAEHAQFVETLREGKIE